MEVKADALIQAGQKAKAHRVLHDAVLAAQEIGAKQAREHNLHMIAMRLKGIEKETDKEPK